MEKKERTPLTVKGLNATVAAFCSKLLSTPIIDSTVWISSKIVDAAATIYKICSVRVISFHQPIPIRNKSAPFKIPYRKYTTLSEKIV
jgi:hypothetical protein